MTKNLVSFNQVLLFLGKVALLTVAVTVIYYFGFLVPKTRIPNALLSAEKHVVASKAAHIENRAAFVELARLNADSNDHYLEIAKIIDTLKKSNEKGLNLSISPPEFESIGGFSNEVLDFLNTELPSEVSNLTKKSREIIERQSKIIATIGGFYTKVEKILEYNPPLDLDTLDPETDKEILLEKMSNAKSGISKIKNDISKDYSESDLVNELQKSEKLLEQMAQDVSNNDFREDSLETFYAQFDATKKEARQEMMKIVRSSEAVDLLVDQTNLISEYEQLLKKIKDQYLSSQN